MPLDFLCFVRKLIEKRTKLFFSLGTLVKFCFLSLNDQRQITFKLENRNRHESVSFRSGAVSKIVMVFTFQVQAMVSFLLQFLLPNYRRFFLAFIIGIEKRHNFSMSFASSVYNQNVFSVLIFLLAWSVRLLLSAEEMPTSCLGFPPLIIHALTMRLALGMQP